MLFFYLGPRHFKRPNKIVTLHKERFFQRVRAQKVSVSKNGVKLTLYIDPKKRVNLQSLNFPAFSLSLMKTRLIENVVEGAF